MRKGGFDAVIGNPPYVQSRSGQLAEMDKEYFEDHFATAEYQLNLYALFLEKGINLVSKEGLLGFIVPNYWLSTDNDARLRHFLFRDNHVRELLNVYKVFEDATVDTLVVLAQKGSDQTQPKVVAVKSVDRSFKTIAARLGAVSKREFAYDQTIEIKGEDQDVRLGFSATLSLKGDKVLSDYCFAKFGMKPYEEGTGTPPQTREMMKDKVYDAQSPIDETYRPLLRAGDVQRYRLNWQNNWIKYGDNLAAPRTADLFTGPRLLLQRIVSRARLDGTWTNDDFVCNTDVITLKLLPNAKGAPDLKFIAGILLSRLCAYYVKSSNVNLDRAVFPKINTNTLSAFPLPHFDKTRHDRMVKLVETMLQLQADRLSAGAQEKIRIEKRIETTNDQIDALVYELYELGEEEINQVKIDGS